jgi:hypothetical protein
MFDSTQGRFLQRDRFRADGMNLYAAYFVPDATDPSGWKKEAELGQQVIVGAIKGGRTSTDQGDKDVQDEYKDKKIRPEEKVAIDCLSYGAKDFYDCLKKKYDSCRDKLKGKPEAEVQKKCCIRKLVQLGHATAGLGGQEGFDKLRPEQVKELKKMMCKGATILVAGCKAFDNQGPYAPHLGLALLLTESGGTYQGYPGLVGGVWPWETPEGDAKKNKMTSIPVTPGEKEAQVREKMEKESKAYWK